MAAQLTLYGCATSPYVEKVELALKEGDIPYKYHSIDLVNKPTFFTERVNPTGKVPAITYGDPDVVPEEPSPLSTKLAESNVILEFLADAYPEANLMPTHPVQRACVRFFVEMVTRKYVPAYMAWMWHSELRAAENLLAVIAFLQGLLSDGGEYAVGESYTIADACITPWIYRLNLSIEYDIGKFPVGGGPMFGELLRDPKYAKFMVYAGAVTARPAAMESWVPRRDVVKEAWIRLFGRESTFEMPLEHLQGRA